MVTAASGLDPSAVVNGVALLASAIIGAWAVIRANRKTARRLNGQDHELSIEGLRTKVADQDKELTTMRREIERKDAALEYQQEQLLEYGRALANCHDEKKGLEKQLAAARGGK